MKTDSDLIWEAYAVEHIKKNPIQVTINTDTVVDIITPVGDTSSKKVTAGTTIQGYYMTHSEGRRLCIKVKWHETLPQWWDDGEPFAELTIDSRTASAKRLPQIDREYNFFS